MDVEVDDRNTSQGAGSIDMEIPNEQETHDNDEDPNLRSYARNRKPPSPYEPFFNGNIYGAQLFGVEMGSKMKTTKNLNTIAVHDVFTQVLQTESAPEAPGLHEQISFERVYKIFNDRSVAGMFKEYKQIEDIKAIIGVNTD